MIVLSVYAIFVLSYLKGAYILMAIGERISFFRKLRGMTQKYLGQQLGFPERSADVRMAQYETGSRSPKAELTEHIAAVLNVSPAALNVPDIDTYTGLFHTFFALEDMYGLTITSYDGDNCIRLGKKNGKVDADIFYMLQEWSKQKERLLSGEITRDEYDEWRYHYPASSTSFHWQHVYPEDLFAFSEHPEED